MKWNGSTWSAQVSGTSQRLTGIWGTSTTNLWAVGENGTILSYDGTAWSAVAVPTGGGVNLQSVWGTGVNDVWAVGWSATILHWNEASSRNRCELFPEYYPSSPVKPSSGNEGPRCRSTAATRPDSDLVR